MDIERTLETQRLKLLRIVAGLLLVVGVLAIGPVSRRFTDWTLGFVGSVLSRAEAAARYLVIVQARLIASRSGVEIDEGRIFERLARVSIHDDVDFSLSQYRRRLKRLRAILLDLPRHAARLLHRIEKLMRRTDRRLPRAAMRLSITLHDWRLAGHRIERPPDEGPSALSPFATSPGHRREALAVALYPKTLMLEFGLTSRLRE